MSKYLLFKHFYEIIITKEIKKKTVLKLTLRVPGLPLDYLWLFSSPHQTLH